MDRASLLRRLIKALHLLRRSRYHEAEKVIQCLYDDVSQISMFTPKDDILK